MSEGIFKEEKRLTQHDVENKQLKEENEKLRKENEQLRKNNVVKDVEIKESIGKPKEIKSLEEDKNTTDSYRNWFDKNKFKNISAIIDRNRFNCTHKIGEFSYIKIKDMVNNSKKNKISKIAAKKGLNTLNELKNAPLNRKKYPNLFNDLSDTILIDKTLKSKSQEDNTLISSKDQNENVNENVNKNENEIVNENVN